MNLTHAELEGTEALLIAQQPPPTQNEYSKRLPGNGGLTGKNQSDGMRGMRYRY
jgi:hypothetical protein